MGARVVMHEPVNATKTQTMPDKGHGSLIDIQHCKNNHNNLELMTVSVDGLLPPPHTKLLHPNLHLHDKNQRMTSIMATGSAVRQIVGGTEND